jgi:hypothetical protein
MQRGKAFDVVSCIPSGTNEFRRVIIIIIDKKPKKSQRGETSKPQARRYDII